MGETGFSISTASTLCFQCFVTAPLVSLEMGWPFYAFGSGIELYF